MNKVILQGFIDNEPERWNLFDEQAYRFTLMTSEPVSLPDGTMTTSKMYHSIIAKFDKFNDIEKFVNGVEVRVDGRLSYHIAKKGRGRKIYTNIYAAKLTIFE